jgi:hypothetical protein
MIGMWALQQIYDIVIRTNIIPCIWTVAERQIEKLKCRCEDLTNRGYVSCDSADFGYGPRPGATVWEKQSTKFSGSITGRIYFDQPSRKSIHKKNSVLLN